MIDLSYMTTCRNPVGQSKEECKDQESIHDAAWHCPVNVWAFSLSINIADRPLSISTARSSFSLAVGDVSFERSVRFFCNFVPL